MKNPPLIISHAGCEGLAPRNSLESIGVALELGINYIEVDVQVTSDGVPILAHDPIVRLLSGQTLVIPETDAKQLVGKRIYVYSNGELGLTTHLGTLEQATTLIPKHVTLIVEIKHPRFDPKYARRMRDVDILQGDKVESAIFDCTNGHNVQYISFYSEVLLNIKRFSSKAICGFVSELSDERILVVAKALGVYHVVPNYRNLGKCFIDLAHQQLLNVFTWTVDKESEMLRLAEMGVDGIITNRPDRALRLFL